MRPQPLLRAPGLYSLITRSVKSKVIRRTYTLPGPNAPGGKAQKKLAGELLFYFTKKRGMELKGPGPREGLRPHPPSIHEAKGPAGSRDGCQPRGSAKGQFSGRGPDVHVWSPGWGARGVRAITIGWWVGWMRRPVAPLVPSALTSQQGQTLP